MVEEFVIAEQEGITGEALAEMGDLGRCELVEGKLVQIAPTGNEHGTYEGNFFYHISTFVRQHDLGKVQVGEVGIYTHRDPDTVRGADVLFISHERYAQQKSTGFLHVAPDLVVEIISPNDRWSEVIEKLREYFGIGVRLVWVADPRSRSVFAYRTLTDVSEYGEGAELSGEEVLPGFSVKVAQLFET